MASERILMSKMVSPISFNGKIEKTKGKIERWFKYNFTKNDHVKIEEEDFQAMLAERGVFFKLMENGDIIEIAKNSVVKPDENQVVKNLEYYKQELLDKERDFKDAVSAYEKNGNETEKRELHTKLTEAKKDYANAEKNFKLAQKGKI